MYFPIAKIMEGTYSFVSMKPLHEFVLTSSPRPALRLLSVRESKTSSSISSDLYKTEPPHEYQTNIDQITLTNEVNLLAFSID
jgi:hypothetical protein